ncbi:Type I restriction-modification system, specificity subunit S [uncultured Candidatus Thioglobus sp.]|nr:Type I restriction-modification system, specificity subunit S [uncultured Candidatus Thioglobus sp.]
MKLEFDITPQEFKIVEEILSSHLTDNCQTWVFGSRVKNKALHNSDLDLALECKGNIPTNIIRQIKTAFEQSKLPYRVDVLDINAVEPYFRDIINQKKVCFPFEVKSKVPPLRFAEFDGEWERKSISDILTIGSGKDYKHLNNGDIPVYGTGGYMTSVDSFLYDGESVCIGRKGTIDKPVLINGKFWTVDTLFYTHSFIDLLPKFLFPLFKRINWKKYNEASGVPSLSKSTIERIKLSLPTKPEQQKIAAFLTAVDNKIEQLSKKQGLLSEYKKGVMQKIFSQTIRFKADDDSDFSDWKEKKLGGVCKVTTGKLDANAMVESGQYRFYTCAKEYYKIDDYAFDTDALIVSGNGANVGYIHHYQGKFNAYQRTYVLDNFTDNIIFVKFILDEYLHKRIVKEKNEGNTPYIVMGTLTDMKINLPSSLEQTKIANFLSSIDSKTEQVTKQLDNSKQFKKALLQQMFV